MDGEIVVETQPRTCEADPWFAVYTRHGGADSLLIAKGLTIGNLA